MAVFAAARSLADANGTISDRHALAPLVGLSQRRVSAWLSVLELRRFNRRALAVRHGARALWVLCVDGIPGVPARGRTESSVDDDDHAPWKRKDAVWRQLRATLGGKDRALKATMAERDDLRVRLAAAEKRYGLEADPQIVALRADMEHAVRCLDPECERCMEIETNLDSERPRYATEHELVDKLAAAEVVRRAGRVLLRAARSQGVGSRAAMAEAARALDLAERGEMREASQILDRMVL